MCIPDRIVAFDLDERWIKWRYDTEREVRAIITGAAGQAMADGKEE